MAMVAAILITAVIVGGAAFATSRWLAGNALGREFGVPPGQDVAEHLRRRLAEADNRAQRAEDERELLRLSLDALTSGVVVADARGTVLIKNRLAVDTTDRPHEQTLIDSAVTELLTSAAQGSRLDREVEIFGPPPRRMLINAVPIAIDDVVVGSLAVIDDVTEHYRIEKTRRDFVANLSHELRTPVGAASLLGEMLVDEGDAEVRQQLTDRLIIETDRMTATIDDLLELSRIESDEQIYDEQVVVQSLVEETLARTRTAAEDKNVNVGSVLPSELITMSGNRGQLLTALVNLVENAIKYSSDGDSVSVRARLEDSLVYLTVQDTGRGIPARDLHRIFERFYRVDRSRDSTTGGTGIGLSIVRHVALNHGGTVDVTSFEGEGSTFTMALPRGVIGIDNSSSTQHEVL